MVTWTGDSPEGQSELMARLVYRGGSRSVDNLTPRLGTDTTGHPGKSPGLSVFTSLEHAAEPGEKAQVFDLDLLKPPLQAFPDDPTLEGGEEDHVSIAPATSEGELDEKLLKDWSAARGTGQTHWLTDLLRHAQVQLNVRRPR
jgi:hypothetical protein